MNYVFRSTASTGSNFTTINFVFCIIFLDVNDELAPKLNDIEDIETHMPGFLAATVEWFKIYKMPDGKPPNDFAFDAKPKNKDFAIDIVKSLHEQWKTMMVREADPDGVSRACTSYECQSKIGKKYALKN